GWCSATVSPGLTSHLTISPSAMPSPTSGSLNSSAMVGFVPVGSEVGDALDRIEDAAVVGEVVVLERVRERRVEAGDAHDGRLHVLDAVLGDERADLRAEAAEARSLVHDHHATGGLRVLEHALLVEREQR